MDLKVGDSVDVPGSMHGTVKYVGEVVGKKGVFAGVQLAAAFASRGKNSGDVDGKVYFRTTTAGSGIFLPLDKAVRRGGGGGGAPPQTPTNPSLATFNQGGRTPATAVSKFSQSIGPGARPASPAAKPVLRRPSLPRPESPLRKAPQTPKAALKARSSLGGPGRSRLSSTPQPGYAATTKPSRLGTSMRGPAAIPSKTPLSPELSFDEESDSVPTPVPVAAAKTNGYNAKDEEIRRLKSRLEEKDRQLKEQASSFTDMEKTLTELQSLLPMGDEPSASEEVAQLKVMLKDKNDKIQMLTAEFDAHRADFRSTIDTLEMASTETERVYEKRVDELLQEVREFQDRGEDVESVAEQLKQLEELVQELEEGLEDARRGEAEARAEVEFLRGEVERGRSELQREKSRKAAAAKSDLAAENENQRRHQRDVEQRDDEIRGLKAIIHSLNRESVSSTTSSSAPNGHAADDEQMIKMERQVEQLEAMMEEKTRREEALEREVARLRQQPPRQDTRKSLEAKKSRRLSDRTVVSGESRDQHPPPTPTALGTERQFGPRPSATEGSALWCEICETEGHDILNCTNMFGSQSPRRERDSPRAQRTGRDVVAEGLKNLTPIRTQGGRGRNSSSTPQTRSPVWSSKSQPAMPNPNDVGMVAGKQSGVIDATRWCALCEKDGHESVDCPFEDML